MKLRTYMLAGVAVIAVALPVAAIAHEHRDRPGHVELDKDGNITPDAVKAASAERFKRLDKNGDGVITPDEAPNMFVRPDANNDGKVTPDELAAVAEARMKRMDANGDGVVSKEERKAARAAFREAHPGMGHHRHHGGDHDGDKGGDKDTPAPAPAPETPPAPQ